MYNDFIQVIVDESALEGSWRRGYDVNISRAFTPMYFVMFFWSGSHFSSRFAFVLRETCGCDGGRDFTLLTNFIPQLKEPNGVERLLKQIQAEKMDFRGRKVTVCPCDEVYGSRESMWKYWLSPFSFRDAHRNWIAAFASPFDAFISQHNFTLDFVKCSDDTSFDPDRAELRMLSTVGCSGPRHQCYGYPLSLFRFELHRILFFSRSVSPEPYSLLSLRSPFSELLAVLMLLGTSLCVAMVILTSARSLDISAVTLSIFSGLLGKSLDISGNRKSAHFYSFWLLIAGIVSVTYTNILQSYVVVPGVRSNDHSFEKRVQRNYSFESMDWELLTNIPKHSAYETATPMSSKEKILAVRVSERAKYLKPGSVNAFINYYSETTKTALVESSHKVDLYASVTTATDRNAIVGKEQFFHVPFWWNFAHVERASLLVRTVENLKGAGILDYFLHLSDLKFRKIFAHTTREMDTNSTDRPTTFSTTGSENSSAPCWDALASECFVLFMYGVLTAIGALLAEVLTSDIKFAGCRPKTVKHVAETVTVTVKWKVAELVEIGNHCDKDSQTRAAAESNLNSYYCTAYYYTRNSI